MEPVDPSDAMPPADDFDVMPLNPQKWLDSRTLRALEPAQIGGLFWLLCHAWVAGKVPGVLPCSVPHDDKALGELSRLGRTWPRLGPAIVQHWTPVVDDAGAPRLRHMAQYADWTKRQEAKAKRQRGPAARDGKRLVLALDDVPPAPQPLPLTEREPVDAALRDYTTQLVVRARQGLASHTNLRLRQVESSIVSADPRSQDVARTLMGMGVPVEFAAAEVFRLASTHNARSKVSGLGFFVEGLTRAWERHLDDVAAATLAPPPTVPPEPKGFASNGARAHTNGSGGGGRGPTSIDKGRQTAAAASSAYTSLYGGRGA